MKKKVLFVGIMFITMLLINSMSYALTGGELKIICDSAEEPIISQYLDDNTDYTVITPEDIDSDDVTILEAVVVGPNGEEYIIIIVNGQVHIMKA